MAESLLRWACASEEGADSADPLLRRLGLRCLRMGRGKTPFTIRPAVLADAESIVRVHHAAVHRSGATSYPREVLDAWSGEPIEARFARMRQAIASADELVLVAEDGPRVIAFGSVVVSLEELRSLYVHPDAWRRGAGAMLLAELERLATGRGLTRLQLKSSLNAEPFYQALGYAVVGPGVHQIGAGLTMSCVKMHKDLILGKGRSEHC